MGIISAFWGWECVTYLWRIWDNKLPLLVINNTSTASCSGSQSVVPSPAASALHVRKVNSWAPTQTFGTGNTVGRGQQFPLKKVLQVIPKLAEISELFGRPGKHEALIWKMGLKKKKYTYLRGYLWKASNSAWHLVYICETEKACWGEYLSQMFLGGQNTVAVMCMDFRLRQLCSNPSSATWKPSVCEKCPSLGLHAVICKMVIVIESASSNRDGTC